MDFNFLEQYRPLTNVELLMIAGQEGIYQPKAIEAAKTILNDRQLTYADMAEASTRLEVLESKKQALLQKKESNQRKVKDLFEPLVRPGEKVTPQQWLNLLLIWLIIQYLWTLYDTGEYLIRLIKSISGWKDSLLLLDYLPLVYMPVIWVLLYKKRRWGWILLFVDNMNRVIARTGEMYFFFKYQRFHHGNAAAFLLPVFMRAAFAYFLWQADIASFFGIDYGAKRKTVLIAFAASVFYTLLIMFVL